MQPVGLSPITAAANLRRSAIASCALGVGAVVISAVLGHPLMGIFSCLGLGLGAANNWMLQRSVIQYGSNAATGRVRFRRGVMGRLSLFTIVGLGIGLLVRPDGLGVIAGLAVFQILMLVGAAVPVFRSLRPS